MKEVYKPELSHVLLLHCAAVTEGTPAPRATASSIRAETAPSRADGPRCLLVRGDLIGQFYAPCWKCAYKNNAVLLLL